MVNLCTLHQSQEMKRFLLDSDVQISTSHGVYIQLTMHIFMIGGKRQTNKGGLAQTISLRKFVLYREEIRHVSSVFSRD